MRSEIRRTTLEETFEQQDTLSQGVVRIVNEAARDQESNGDASGSQTPWSEGDQQSEISQARGEQHDCDSGSAQEINKHVSDGVNKHPTENKCDLKPKPVKTKEAKDHSKSETEMVDVMDTLQRTISIIEMEIAKNHTFVQKEIGTRNTNFVTAALIMMKTSRRIAFSKQC